MDDKQQPVQNALETISATELQNADISPLQFIVDGILPEGLAILVAPPKFGKSWMSLDLCLTVATGKPFLNRKTCLADSLYLALEDSFRRLQGRQEKLLQGTEAPGNCFFAIAAGTVDGALPAQIDAFMKDHPNTRLIVVDVLARVRSHTTTTKTDAYKLDYSDMGVLKNIADRYHICVLVVHHTRKMRDESDVFNDISGSNGIMGAADTALVLCKEKRGDTRAILHVIGRDVESQEMIIELGTDCRWKLMGSPDELKLQSDIAAFKDSSLVRLICQMLNEAPDGVVKTTAEALLHELQCRFGSCGGMDSARKVGRFIADRDNKAMFQNIGIELDESRDPSTRWKVFRKVQARQLL